VNARRPSPPPPRCRLPAALQGLLWFARPIELLEYLRREHGDVVALDLPELDRLVLLSRAEDIKAVFGGDAEVLHAGAGNDPLEPILGSHSLLLLDGREHLRQRRLMLPSFHGARMQAYAETMRDITLATIRGWRRGRPLSLLPSMQHITLEVILRTVFGADERDELDELRARVGSLLDRVTGPLAFLFLVPSMQRDFGPLRLWSIFQRELAAADAAIYRHIERRRRRHGAEREDVLALLLEARDDDGQPLSRQELRDELMTLVIAGHETTAIALAWAFERILATPRVHDALRSELDRVVGREPLAPAQLASLPYLDATIKETLRLRPVIPLVARKLAEPIELAGYRIERGVRLAPCIYLAQRDPARYPDPDAFEPERFLDKKADPYSWLPFGGGVRRCIGMAFALYEMKVVIATILSQLDLEPCETKPARVARRGITFAPRGGARVTWRRREAGP
jgi:cytochrome P450